MVGGFDGTGGDSLIYGLVYVGLFAGIGYYGFFAGAGTGTGAGSWVITFYLASGLVSAGLTASNGLIGVDSWGFYSDLTGVKEDGVGSAVVTLLVWMIGYTLTTGYVLMTIYTFVTVWLTG